MNRCFSVKTKEFEDCLASYYHVKEGKAPEKDKKKYTQLMEVMRQLEQKENDPTFSPTVKINGKTLGKQSDGNIYSLEIGFDRAMAVIVEQDNKKVYIWFWAGSHEEYSKKIKKDDFKKKSNNLQSGQQETITDKIQEIKKTEPPKPQDYMKNIGKMRENYNSKQDKAKKDKKYR